MKNTKVLNLFFETGNVVIRLVPNPAEADVIVKEDGSIELAGKDEPCKDQSMESKNLIPEQVQQHEEVDLETEISKILIKLGIPASIKGYRYLREALKLAIEDPEIMNAVTKSLYPKVAECFDTTANRAERAIRHAIEVSVDRGDKKLLNKYFTYSSNTSKKKPTNSEFIAGLADYFRRTIKNK